MKNALRIGLFLAVISLCGLAYAQDPADPEATPKTRNLLVNLHQIATQGFMFGHQDDQAYGVGWKEEKGRSDVKDVVGHYPAVHGWDVGSRLDNDANLDKVRFGNMKHWIKKAYRMGAVNTISWHMDNLTTGGNAWDTTASVSDILPGGSHHEEFVHQLDLLADMLNGLHTTFSKIPVIFRPWHEHNGNWFWWGRGNCTEEEYIRLYRFTVDYLRKTKHIHHLLYAFSPDRSRLRLDTIPESNYLYGYPGDDYVDIIGLDDYGDVGRIGGPDTPVLQQEKFIKSLKLITQIAKEKNKVAALTETGLEGVTNPEWFTHIILDPILSNDDEIDIAYVMVWRNATTHHHYAPYKGHASVPDFLKFYENPETFFEGDLKNPYRKQNAMVE